MNNSKLKLSISYVFIFTICAKLLGFIREMVLSGFFGASGISDAYLISQNIPGTIFLFVGTGLSTCYIPVYYRVLKSGGKEKAHSFTGNVLSIVFIFSAVVIALVWLFTPLVVKAFAYGFEGETLEYAIGFTRICILSLFFSTIIYVYSSFLQVNDKFGLVAFSAIPNTLIVMLAIVLGAKVNIWLLSIVSVVAILAQAVILFPEVHKLGFRYNPLSQYDKPTLKLFFGLIGPVIIGVSVNEINTLVDRTIASQIAEGAISALTYANSLIQLVQGGVVQPVVTVYYPSISSAVTERKYVEIETNIKRIESFMLTLLLPISAFLMLFCKDITKVLFERGAFGSEAIKMTAVSLLFYSIGICFVGLREPICRLFYAYSDTKTPMLNASIGLIVNIVLNIILSRLMGIGGLALATSISALFSFVLLYFQARKKISGIKIKIGVLNLLKDTIGTVFFIMGAFIIYSILKDVTIPLISLAASGIIGLLVYVLIGYLLKNESIIMLVKMCSKIFRKLVHN